MLERVSVVEREVNSNTAPFPDDRVMSLTFTSEVVKVPEVMLKRGELCEVEVVDEMEREESVSVPVAERRKREAEREEEMERENVLRNALPSPTLNIV